MGKDDLIQEIDQLRKEKEAVILAHNYQLGEVQDIADFVGDSLELSIKASQTEAKIILFCGVRFMAETAYILSPDKTVLIPDRSAGCPLADMIKPMELMKLKKEHPDAYVVCYVNSTAEIKALSDFCCTSANAVRVVEEAPSNEIIFVPDRNLGRFVSRFTKKKLMLTDGYCYVHNNLTREEVQSLKEVHPQAEFIAHPECREEVLDIADAVLSTSGMLRHAKQSENNEFIVGTETGLLYRLAKENPEKRFYPASEKMVCRNMKYSDLGKVRSSLLNVEFGIEVWEDVREKAYGAVNRMLEIVE